MKIKNENLFHEDVENNLPTGEFVDKNNKEKPSIYAGSEEKMLNLVVEIIVKIIIKEVL